MDFTTTRKGLARSSSSSSCSSSSMRRGRFAEAAEGSSTREGDGAECTWRSCRSCAAVAVADCVALCCCPCAVVSLLALAFLKAPWVVGRRCVRILIEKKKMKRRVVDDSNKRSGKSMVVGREGEGITEDGGSLGAAEGGGVRGGGEEGGKWCDGVEAERVWLELYQAGQLGFGRVSFNGGLQGSK